MSLRLSELHHSKIVLLDRISLNMFASMLTPKTDEQIKLMDKVLERATNKEVKANKPCMNLPIRVWELKKLFPNYETNPPIYWERHE